MCPCGKGKVIRHVVSWDNPWSGTDASVHLECSNCASEWELDRTGSTLTLRSSLMPVNSALREVSAARGALDRYLRALAGQHFNDCALKSKKMEHALLVELKVYGASYGTYLKDRKTRSMAEVCHLGGNQKFVEELIAQRGDRNQVDALKRVISEKDAALNNANAQVVRWQVCKTP